MNVMNQCKESQSKPDDVFAFSFEIHFDDLQAHYARQLVE